MKSYSTPKKNQPVLTQVTDHALPTAEWIMVGPTQAAQWLERNERNRQLSASTAQRYAHDMAEGRWLDTGDPIRIATDGLVLDGQHRLKAIVLSGTTHRLLVVRNVRVEAQRAMDGGKRRTLADEFRMRGLAYSRDRAAWVRTISEIATGSRGALSIADEERIQTRHAAGLAWASGVVTDANVLRRAPIMGALIYAYAVDPVAVDAFAEQAKTGANLAAHSPALALRNFATNHLTRFRENPRDASLKTLRCVHAHLLGQPITVLVVNETALRFFLKRNGDAE